MIILSCLLTLSECSKRSVEVKVDGHNGPISVKVSVDHSHIESIEYYNHQETLEVVQQAAETMIDAIIANQSLAVDVASGATVTCQAILKGCENALIQLGFHRNQLYQNNDNEYDEIRPSEKQYDVIIVGAGGAGLSAAVMAAREGASVAVLEKMSEPGGNTVRATAMYNCVDDKLQHPLGIYDSEEDFYNETYNGGYQKAKPELVRILTSQADEGKLFLEELGLQFDTVIDNCLGGKIARGHYSLAHNGTDYVQVLWQACNDLGVDFYLNTKANELIMAQDSVIGVEAYRKGETIEFYANNGVVLASGGFGQNVEMRMYYNRNLTGELLCSNAPGATGDGIIMASKIGASLINMEYIELYPMGDSYDGGLRNSIPNVINKGILVNQQGQRFVREDGARDVLSQAILDQKGSYAYSIVDDDFEIFADDRSYLEGLVLMGYVEKANSIDELAQLIDIDADILINTIDQYNQSVALQSDCLGRETLINAIDKPPFYANMKKPTIHHTLGGIEINEMAQVLNQDKQPINGLFAAGEVTGGIHGANRLGGNSFPDMIVFGRIAGKNAALNQ